MDKKYGISITTYNRYDFWDRCATSLSKSIIFDGTLIIISDDNSFDKRITERSEKLKNEICNCEIITHKNDENIGPQLNYKKNLLRFKPYEVDILISLDSDAIFNKNWMIKLDDLFKKFDYNALCSVFYSELMIKLNPIFMRYEDYVERSALNGLGMSFPKKILDVIEKMPDNVNNMDSFVPLIARNMGLKCYSTNKSYIEHLGVGYNTFYDHATNFVGEE